MSSEHAEATNTSAVVATQGAAVAPEKAGSKKVASHKKGAPKGQKNAKTAKPKAAAASQPRKATPAKTAKAPKAAKAKAEGVREGSKTATILELLRQPGGASLAKLMKASGWQKHSIRGLLSGTVGKKMGLTVTSSKGEDGERIYSLDK